VTWVSECVDGSAKHGQKDAVYRGPGFEWFGSEAEKQRKAGQDALEFVCVRQPNMLSTQRATVTGYRSRT